MNSPTNCTSFSNKQSWVNWVPKIRNMWLNIGAVGSVLLSDKFFSHSGEGVPILKGNNLKFWISRKIFTTFRSLLVVSITCICKHLKYYKIGNLPQEGFNLKVHLYTTIVLVVDGCSLLSLVLILRDEGKCTLMATKSTLTCPSKNQSVAGRSHNNYSLFPLVVFCL